MKIVKASMIALALVGSTFATLAQSADPLLNTVISVDSTWDVDAAKKVGDGKPQRILHRTSQLVASKVVYEVKKKAIPQPPLEIAYFAEIKFMDVAPVEKTERAFVTKAPQGADWYWVESGK